MVICLEQGADLHMAQLMPLPLTVSCSNKIQIGFTFLVPAHLGSPEQRVVKRVCVYLCAAHCQRLKLEIQLGKFAVVNITTFRLSLDTQLVSLARQIVIGKFSRFEHAIFISDGRLIEVARVGTARQVAFINPMSKVVTSLQQFEQESHVLTLLCKLVPAGVVRTGNENAPIQLAQCRFPGLAISDAKILIYFSNKIYGSNFIKQHSEAVMV